MTYHLLTGATGLLGSYLLRDSLRQRHRLAVLVRPTKRESARQRIESILSRCEADLRTPLPRPVMIEGELTEANLGLDGADLRWISRHCRSVIHNAANLTFHSNGREGEPWRSNFDGTRRILELCRTTGIAKLRPRSWSSPPPGSIRPQSIARRSSWAIHRRAIRRLFTASTCW